MTYALSDHHKVQQNRNDNITATSIPMMLKNVRGNH
jgi:hypothetical protein